MRKLNRTNASNPDEYNHSIPTALTECVSNATQNATACFATTVKSPTVERVRKRVLTQNNACWDIFHHF